MTQQTTFSNWKNTVRFKARSAIADGRRIGGGPPLEKKLSELKERAINLQGREAVDGNEIGVVSIGIMAHDEAESSSTTIVIIAEVPSTIFSNVASIFKPKRILNTPTAVSQEYILNTLKEGDAVLTNSINNWADSVKELAHSIVESSSLNIVEAHNTQTITLLELLQNKLE